MKHKTKVIILSIITVFLVLFAILRVVSSVRADDSGSAEINEFNVAMHYNYSSDVSFDLNFSYSSKSSKQYLVGLFLPPGVSDTQGRIELFCVDIAKKSYHWVANENVYNYTRIKHEIGKDDVTYTRDIYNWVGFLCEPEGLVVTGIPVYTYPNGNKWLEDTEFWNNVIDCNIFPTYGSVAPWDTSNHYSYSSTYSKGVTAPSVREVLLSYGNYNPTSSATVYNSDSGHSGGGGSGGGRGKQYIIDVKYQVPNTDVSDYYTELWLDVPTGRDKDNNVTYHKVCAAEFKTSELFTKNIIQVSSGQGGWTSLDKGGYYSIYKSWNELIGKFCSIDNAKMYGGVIVYLRNSIHTSDNKTLVSDYVYFTLNPNNVIISDEGATSSTPAIYNKPGALNENGPSINDIENDKKSDNSGDFDYIGGLTDKPKDYIHSDDNGGSDSGGGDFIPSKNWTLEDFTYWVKHGFGLFGNNGILSMVADVFSFIPADVFNILMWVVLCAGIIAVIKLVF